MKLTKACSWLSARFNITYIRLIYSNYYKNYSESTLDNGDEDGEGIDAEEISNKGKFRKIFPSHLAILRVFQIKLMDVIELQ